MFNALSNLNKRIGGRQLTLIPSIGSAGAVRYISYGAGVADFTVLARKCRREVIPKQLLFKSSFRSNVFEIILNLPFANDKWTRTPILEVNW